jgi:neutral ceramidase
MLAPTRCRLAMLPCAILLAAGSVLPAADPAKTEKPTLRAGAAAVDITPAQFPLNMPGGFGPNPATGAHDPFHARALVLDDGRTTLAMVVVDTLGMGREPVDEAKAIAFKATGIPMDKILISSTHTHTGPPSNTKEGDAPAIAYRKQLIDGVARSIVEAHKQLRPAAVAAAAHPLPDEVFNRRWFMKPGKMPLNPYGLLDQVKMNPGIDPAVLDRPAGPTDPDVTILSVVEPNGKKPIAVYANYSLHYVGGTSKEQLSADYFGEFARLLPSRVRGDERFVAMLSNGTSGDINNTPFPMGQPPRPPREPFEQIRLVAAKTADAAWHARNKITEHKADARLGMVERLVTLKLRKPTPAQLEAAKAVLAIKDEAKIAELPRLAQEYARRAVSAAKNPESTIDVQVQAIRVGDLAICCIPFETFCEIGLELKDASPFGTTMVVGLANARHGYLPTPEQHRLGGYETWLGTNQVEENASVILVKNLKEMLAELKAAK